MPIEKFKVEKIPISMIQAGELTVYGADNVMHAWGDRYYFEPHAGRASGIAVFA
jgi:hypothetical protein